MLKVGLTGGIASGKSLVGEMFVALGAHLIEADKISHALMQPGESVYQQVVQHFGREILNADGTVNRAKLAELAFGVSASSQNRPSRIDELNKIVHLAVIRAQEKWLDEVGAKDSQAIAIVEAALLIEAKIADHFDKLIVVTCNEGQRAARFAQRQKIDLAAARKEVARRMSAQLPDTEKVKLADFVIDNSGSIEATRSQVTRAWNALHAAS
jgi:dephospho-CoA kinase